MLPHGQDPEANGLVWRGEVPGEAECPEEGASVRKPTADGEAEQCAIVS